MEGHFLGLMPVQSSLNRNAQEYYINVLPRLWAPTAREAFWKQLRYDDFCQVMVAARDDPTTEHPFLVPFFKNTSILNPTLMEIVFLKDCWRHDAEDVYHREGDIYFVLKTYDVLNALLFETDIGNVHDHVTKPPEFAHMERVLLHLIAGRK